MYRGQYVIHIFIFVPKYHLSFSENKLRINVVIERISFTILETYASAVFWMSNTYTFSEFLYNRFLYRPPLWRSPLKQNMRNLLIKHISRIKSYEHQSVLEILRIEGVLQRKLRHNHSDMPITFSLQNYHIFILFRLKWILGNVCWTFIWGFELTNSWKIKQTHVSSVK